MRDDRSGPPSTPDIAGAATLDDLFRRAAARRPEAVALTDPPNRTAFTHGVPRRLTYAQADRVVSQLAARLREMGLSGDAIVAFQTANTVESVVTLLAVLRAGLIAMPLPLLWRRADAAAALERVGASALIVSGRVGKADHFDLAMQVAADVFAVRHVGGFGANAPDGVLALDDVFADAPDAAASTDAPCHDPQHDPWPSTTAEQLAVITWDVASGGLVPVARSHAELVAGGLAVMLEGNLAQDGVILSTLMSASFASLATAVLPWLLTGGTLVLHHPFDRADFAAQVALTGCHAVVLPGPLAAPCVAAGYFAGHDTLKAVLGVWRAPERAARAPAFEDASLTMVDVLAFGETGLIAARRTGDGTPAVITFGTMSAPRDSQGVFDHAALAVGELRASTRGTIAMRGPMVPRGPFPAGAERALAPHFRVAPDGFVDTGYACQLVAENGPMVITAPPPGIVGVGGYRFVTRELQSTVAGVEGNGTLAQLPDALAGHRLAGSAGDASRVATALRALGLNALVSGAFAATHRKPPNVARASDF